MSGAGDIKLTKDGNVLLHEMVSGAAFFHPALEMGRVGFPLNVGFVYKGEKKKGGSRYKIRISQFSKLDSEDC